MPVSAMHLSSGGQLRFGLDAQQMQVWNIHMSAKEMRIKQLQEVGLLVEQW